MFYLQPSRVATVRACEYQKNCVFMGDLRNHSAIKLMAVDGEETVWNHR